MKAQRDGSDELGWLADCALTIANGEPRRPCPKAIRRAHARLLRERAEADQLRAENERLRSALTALCAAVAAAQSYEITIKHAGAEARRDLQRVLAECVAALSAAERTETVTPR